MAAVWTIPSTEPAPAGSCAAPAERAARATLRTQIARLERELAILASELGPARLNDARRLDHRMGGQLVEDPRRRTGPTPSMPKFVPPQPRLLSLGELERTRDALAIRLTTLRRAAAEQAARHGAARAELEDMLADPPAHKWRRLSNADLGRPGCTTYHVRPKAGVLGMLMGWWEVKVSGGCP